MGKHVTATLVGAIGMISAAGFLHMRDTQYTLARQLNDAQATSQVEREQAAGERLALNTEIHALQAKVAALTPDAPLDPSDATERAARGEHFFLEGDLSTAFVELAAAIDLDPQSAAPHFTIARIQELYGMDDDALHSYVRFLTLAPNSPEARRVEARIEMLAAETLPDETDTALAYAEDGAGYGYIEVARP